MRKIQEFKEFFALGTKQHLHRNDLRQDEYIMILYSLDKSLAINGINLRQEYQKGTVEEMQYLLVVHRRMSNG